MATANNTGNKDYDKCCGGGCCKYPNGPFTIIVAQCMVFAGMFLSAATLGDCSFVTTRQVQFPASLGIPVVYEDPNNPIIRRGVGFFFWELHDSGKCSWELFDTALPESVLEEIWKWYFDEVLDSQWDVARILAGIAWFLAFVTWWIILFATCMSYARPFRYVIAFILIVAVTTLQCCSYIVFRSDICSDNIAGGCEMGRGAWYSFGAVLSYFIAACCFISMKDYPGVDNVNNNNNKNDDEENDQPPTVVVASAADTENNPREDSPQHEEGDEAEPDPENDNNNDGAVDGKTPQNADSNV
jgi:hypothetical protein